MLIRMDAIQVSDAGYYPPPRSSPATSTSGPRRTTSRPAPAWCSVDLRDGNQSLVVPMSLEAEAGVLRHAGARSASRRSRSASPRPRETEYDFLRTLIEQNLIPEDVTVQVLTQCREHIIRKTFEACQGCHPGHYPLL